LDALSRLTVDVEVLVIDNDPGSDRTRTVVRRHPRVRYVREPRRGTGWARNRALLEARTPLVAFVDDDVQVQPRWAEAVLMAFDANPDADAVTGLVSPTELATRAQVVFAQQGAEGGVAEDYMRQFYALVREPSGGSYDPARAAALELGWWVVPRNREQYPDTVALVDALAALYAEVYRLAPRAGRPAAEHRALAMEASDRWIREGKDPASPLLETVRAGLVLSCRALADAIAARGSVRSGPGGRVSPS